MRPQNLALSALGILALLGLTAIPRPEVLANRQEINIGSTANDGTGDTLRVGFDKANDNFVELYAGGAEIRIAASDSLAAVIATAQYACDGTDDEVQINAALATGVPVRILPGAYSTADSIEMPDDSRLIIDTGATITLAAASNVPVLTNADTVSGNTNITVEGGGVFNHNGSNQTTSSHCVLFDTVTDLTLKGFKATEGRGWDLATIDCVRFNLIDIEAYGPSTGGANTGGLSTHGTFGVISNCISRDHTTGSGYGLWVTGSDIAVTNCLSYGNDDDNLVVGNAAANAAVRITISNSSFTDSVSDAGAHFTSGCNEATVTNCIFSGNALMGAKVSGSDIYRIAFNGCSICDNLNSGLSLAGTQVVVSGCIIEGNAHRGLYMQGTTSLLQVLNSRILDNTGNNIESHSSIAIENVLIANNVITDGFAWGIALNGTRNEVMVISNFLEGNSSGGLTGGGSSSGVTTQLNWGAQKPADQDERD